MPQRIQQRAADGRLNRVGGAHEHSKLERNIDPVRRAASDELRIAPEPCELRFRKLESSGGIDRAVPRLQWLGRNRKFQVEVSGLP
jgi:hypothetical protein